MQRVRPKRVKGSTVDPMLLAITEEPKLKRQHSTKAKTKYTLPTPDNGVGFILWSKHNGMDQINGPNGKRVARVIYDDGSEQVL